MKFNLFKFAIIVLTVGILSACGSQPTAAPASAPTEASVPATQAPSNPTADPGTSSQATQAPAGQASVSFTNDVLPILENRCVSCHGGERTSEGLTLKSYESVMAGSDNGPVVTAGDAGNSLLAQLVAQGKMPKRGPKLTPDQIQLITNWITQGAQNN